MPSEDFKVRAREGVVKLEAGNVEALSAWDLLCVEYQKVHDALDIQKVNERGKSFYNPCLEGVITDLEEAMMAAESEGATTVFLEGFSGRDTSLQPGRDPPSRAAGR